MKSGHELPLFVADALVGFSRSARGIDDDAISRRLASANVADVRAESHVELIRRKVEVPGWVGQLGALGQCRSGP